MQAYYLSITFIVLSILFLILLFVLGIPKENIKPTKVLVYSILGLLVLIGLGYLGMLEGYGIEKKNNPRLLGFLILLTFLFLGTINTWLLESRKTFSFRSKLFFTLFLALFTAGILSLIHINTDSAYSFEYLGALIVLPVPAMVVKAWEAYLDRPEIPKPTTTYSTQNFANHPPLDFSQTVPLKIIFAPLPLGEKVEFNRVIPSNDSLEVSIFFFWKSLLESDNLRVKITALNANEAQFKFEFSTLKYKFLPFKKVVDAKKSANQLSIKPKETLFINRIYT